MSESLLRTVGWVTYFNATAAVISFVSLIVFFAVGGIWGTLNDAVSVFWALSFIPVAVLLFQMHRASQPLLLPATIVGIAAMLVFAVLQGLLAAGQVRFEQTLSAVLITGGLTGLLFLVNGLVARSGQTLPAGLAWLMIVYGAAHVLSAIGWLTGGMQSPLAAGGMLVGFIAGPVWAYWLARLLVDGGLHVLAEQTLGGVS